jgi:hypothetical protein
MGNVISPLRATRPASIMKYSERFSLSIIFHGREKFRSLVRLSLQGKSQLLIMLGSQIWKNRKTYDRLSLLKCVKKIGHDLLLLRCCSKRARGNLLYQIFIQYTLIYYLYEWLSGAVSWEVCALVLYQPCLLILSCALGSNMLDFFLVFIKKLQFSYCLSIRGTYSRNVERIRWIKFPVHWA